MHHGEGYCYFNVETKSGWRRAPVVRLRCSLANLYPVGHRVWDLVFRRRAGAAAASVQE